MDFTAPYRMGRKASRCACGFKLFCYNPVRIAVIRGIHVSSRTPSRFLSVYLYSTLSFPLQFPEETPWKSADLGPKSAKSAQYPGIFQVSSVSPQILPRPALRLRETRELPEWSSKHPLVSLEISGNEKCWGPSGFLFGFRKHGYRPSPPLPSKPESRVQCASPRERCADGLLQWVAGIIRKRSMKKPYLAISAKI